MANLIQDNLYRVSIDSERNHVYISAKDPEDLIRYLVDRYVGKHDIYGAKEIHRDSSITTVSVVTNPLFQRLKEEKLHPRFAATYIDGQPFAVRLPAGGTHKGAENEWDDLINGLDQSVDLLHCKDVFSWCQDPVEHFTLYHVARGSAPELSWIYSFSGNHADSLGFRPVLEPLNPDTLSPDPSILAGIPDGTTLRMGTLYMDGYAQKNPSKPVWDGDIPNYKPGSMLGIGNTSSDPEKQIQWIKFGDKLIADRNLLHNISWDDLDRQGLAFGKGPKEVEKDQPDREKTSLDSMIQSAQQKTSYAHPSQKAAIQQDR